MLYRPTRRPFPSRRLMRISVDRLAPVVPSGFSFLGGPPVAVGEERQGTWRVSAEDELVWCRSGGIDVEMLGRRWLVGPESGLWVPGALARRIVVRRDSEAGSVFFSADALAAPPQQPMPVSVPPVFQELLGFLHATPLPPASRRNAQDLGIGLLAGLGAEDPGLPLLHEPHALPLAQALPAEPAETSLEQWSRSAGRRPRSLTELLGPQLLDPLRGVCLEHWELLVRLDEAARLLDRGMTVPQVARCLRWPSASAFVAEFRRLMGREPGRTPA